MTVTGFSGLYVVSDEVPEPSDEPVWVVSAAVSVAAGALDVSPVEPQAAKPRDRVRARAAATRRFTLVFFIGFSFLPIIQWVFFFATVFPMICMMETMMTSTSTVTRVASV